MERTELQKRLTAIFRDVMDNEEITLCDSTTSDDIEEWDSLSHIQLVAAMEKDLGVKITSREVRGWENVGEMTDALLNKLA